MERIQLSFMHDAVFLRVGPSLKPTEARENGG
jgi:hypothetical protein